ncbi:MAG: FAD-dependent oxidoreductase [Candidatus Brennerbacteria bacterium]|nr:FAD-dependent oxidoreductase [Candidatus Brennerbacteria bacterium]
MRYDLVIIGGGPAGVAGAVYAARKKLKTRIIAEAFGGQSLVSASVENWIGTPKASGFDLGEMFKAHLKAQEGLEIGEGEHVERIEPIAEGFRVLTERGDSYETNGVLLATGSVRRKLGVPGERELEGRGVAYCSICDAPLFGGKDVAVVGGGNSGLEAVGDLLPYAKHVFLFHHAAALAGDPATRDRVLADKEKVTVILNAETTMVAGDAWVTGIRYRLPAAPSAAGADETRELSVEGVFVEVGLDPASALVKDLVALNDRGEVITDPHTQATSRPGIWAAGDVTDGRYRQNNISAGDAVKAVLHIYETFTKAAGVLQ